MPEIVELTDRHYTTPRETIQNNRTLAEPEVGAAARLISRISRQISIATFGRPPGERDFQRQYKRKAGRPGG
jgi:hypothetical protein